LIKAAELNELMASLPTKDIYGTPSQELKDNSLKLAEQMTKEFKSLAEQHVGSTVIKLNAEQDVGSGSVTQYSAKEVWQLLEANGYHFQLMIDFHDAFTLLVSWPGNFPPLQLGFHEMNLDSVIPYV
jgi:L-alanine-DL-glutamate epimerase-like enolase superfamily enzyme